MSNDRSELMSLIDKARYNPSAIQRAVIDQLERTYNGELEIIDPMNPFVFLTEAMATVGATQMLQAEMLTRRQYPQNALSFEELYHHMSDSDYLGRFATPASVKMNLLLGKDELISRAVSIGVGNVRKLTIPRHTTFKVADTFFTMQYPIDIRVMGHGGLQIVYDGTKDSPLYNLESNKVNWSIENYNLEHQEFINIEIPVHQFRIDSFNASLNGTSSFKKTYTLNDQFYHCRAFMATRAGDWSEISTTHSDQVFDPLKPTLLLKVVGNLLMISLPQVYYTTGLANAELRIDIYTTKGPMELPLQTYIPNAFSAKWIDYDKDDNGKFVAPLMAMTTIALFSTDTITGGTNGLSFEGLRERVMRNTLGSNDIPITPAQISARLTDLGYNSVLNIDNITNRVYLATRALPAPTQSQSGKRLVSAGAGATMGMLSTTISELVKHSSVIDNGTRLTITPDMLYQNVEGLIKTVSDQELTNLKSMGGDQLIRLVNDREYLYSPLHYVLDIGENAFVTRPYYFGKPAIKAKHFVEDNDTTQIGVNSSVHALTRTASGWRLVVKTDTDKSYKALRDDQVNMQLCFKPIGETDNAYMNGTYLGRDPDTEERIFEFLIETDWDLDAKSSVGLTSFSMYEPVNRVYTTALLTSFDIIYTVNDYSPPGYVTGWIDQQLGGHLLPNDSIGIYYERLTVSLGDSLEGLWTRARAVVGDANYERYSEDVLATYSETIYERDETGAIVLTTVDGSPEFTVKHRKGDLVLDSSGNPITLFYAGEVKLDENRNPVTSNPRGVVRQMDIFMVDGVYYFATGQSDVDYIATVPSTLVNWLVKDIRPLGKKVLEKTSLYLHPRSTVGYINVVVGEGQQRKILAAQQPIVTFNVNQSVYKDSALRASIEESATEVIANLFNKAVIARDEIQTMIKTVVGTDIIGVEVTGIGGMANYTTLTVKDDSGRLCIGKRLITNPDGTLIVQDDIQFVFVNHAVF
jgi:hypothetical protein